MIKRIIRSLIKSGRGTGPMTPSNRSGKELVLNPAKQFIVLKDKRGVVLLFVMKPLFSGEVFYFW